MSMSMSPLVSLVSSSVVIGALAVRPASAVQELETMCQISSEQLVTELEGLLALGLVYEIDGGYALDSRGVLAALGPVATLLAACGDTAVGSW